MAFFDNFDIETFYKDISKPIWARALIFSLVTCDKV